MSNTAAKLFDDSNNTATNTELETVLDLDAPKFRRGCVVELRAPISGATELAIVISNDAQNYASDYLLCVPLERRSSRLSAPFAVDLGRNEGFRDLHAARCDWVQRIGIFDIERVERPTVTPEVLFELEVALKRVLDLPEGRF